MNQREVNQALTAIRVDMHQYIPVDEEISEAEIREVRGQAIMFLNKSKEQAKLHLG